MAIQIDKFNIHGFRGIQELTVENLNHINLIVGDNNCGKTSVLEALLLLRKQYNEYSSCSASTRNSTYTPRK